jgi:ribonuclease BN (tRNA processing enzyme)
VVASYPAQALVISGLLYVVDCGEGTSRQLALAGLRLPEVRHVFLTHWHADHVCGYGSLLLLSWLSGRTSTLHAWGPKPLERHTALWREAQSVEVADGRRFGLPSFGRTVRTHQFNFHGSRVLLRTRDVTVTSARVDHPQLRDAYAYRFDTRACSVVFSGDTRRSPALESLAYGCDILVHEVIDPGALDGYMATVPNANPDIRRRILESHTRLDEVGEVAAGAGARMLVLTHRVPEWVGDDVWIRGARVGFDGEVVLAKDFLTLPLTGTAR